MYQPLIKFHPHPAIITQVLAIFVALKIQIVAYVANKPQWNGCSTDYTVQRR